MSLLAHVPGKPALPGCRIFRSSLVEETRERISQLMQPHDLKPLRPLASVDAAVDFLQLPDMGVGAFRFGPMGVSIERLADYHLLILCLKGAAVVKVGRDEIAVTADQGVCLSPGDPLSARFSDDCEQLVLRIDDRLMRRTTEGRVRLRPVLSLARPELQPWLKTLSLLIGQADMIDLVRRDPGMAGGFQDMFVHALLEGQGAAAHSEGAPGSVKRAQDFMEDCYGENLSLGEIAAAAGVPNRTLLHNFQRFCGVSPMQYLRDLRLGKARERLGRAGPSASVTSVALDCGFTHFGRFAQAYGARFGEHPSHTLAASRSAGRLKAD
jgi:AraC-like DNA-binding protein